MGRALIPLDVIASNIAADLGDSTGKHKFKIMRHLLSGYRDIHMFVDHVTDIKTQILSCSNAISLPKDFVFETKVGLMCNGRLAVLNLDKTNHKVAKMSDSQCRKYLDDIWAGSYSGDGFYFYNAFRGGQFLGELYGAGRGVSHQGTYTIDRKEGVIYIGSLIPSDAEIVVEYKSDGSSMDGLKLVPVEMEKALEYYAKAEWYADRNITQSQINRNKYEASYNKIKRLYNFQNALYMSNRINEMFSPTNF